MLTTVSNCMVNASMRSTESVHIRGAQMTPLLYFSCKWKYSCRMCKHAQKHNVKLAGLTVHGEL